LTLGEQQRLAKPETPNTEAYQLFLRGRFYFNKGDIESQKKAVEYIKQSIAADPNYALAHAELSVVYSALIGSSVLDPKEFVPQAEAAAQKSLQLDDSLAEAHYAVAYIKTYLWEWTTTERELKRNLELNPNSAAAHSGYAIFLTLMKRHDEAIVEAKRAQELDPLSLWINANLGGAFHFAHQYDQAVDALNKTIELDRNFPLAYIYLGYVYAGKGMYREARASYQEGIKRGDYSTSTQAYLGAACAKAGDRDQAKMILNKLLTSKDYVSPVELSVLYDSLGQRDKAIASLEKGFASHDIQFPWVSVDPAFDGLRSDPRFQGLLMKIGL
jgi:Tfp pilus assembly protein PilF